MSTHRGSEIRPQKHVHFTENKEEDARGHLHPHQQPVRKVTFNERRCQAADAGVLVSLPSAPSETSTVQHFSLHTYLLNTHPPTHPPTLPSIPPSMRLCRLSARAQLHVVG